MRVYDIYINGQWADLIYFQTNEYRSGMAYLRAKERYSKQHIEIQRRLTLGEQERK